MILTDRDQSTGSIHRRFVYGVVLGGKMPGEESDAANLSLEFPEQIGPFSEDRRGCVHEP